MGLTPTQSRVLKFGVFEIDLEAGELRKSGMRHKLARQPLEALCILLEHPQEIVSREEMRHRLWPDNTFVDYELAVKRVINRLREALGDSAENPKFIETVPRRGYRFIAPVSGNGTAMNFAVELPSASPNDSFASPSHPTRGGIAFGLIAATLLLGAMALPASFWQRHSGSGLSSQIRSIAVLPLQNLSSDPAQEYFSDGMTDALITDLAQIGSLRVISRTSSMQYKQSKKSLPEIARELNVDGIIEGTVQRSGDRVRITAQLIHGPTDKHLWANGYERDLRDVFALERDVTEDIARQVQARLTTPNQSAMAQLRPINTKALDVYLQGSFHLNGYGKGVGDEEKRKAAEYFQQAIDAEPKFASAYNGLANSHLGLLWPSNKDSEFARRMADRAVELDPNSSDAHLTLGDIRETAWNWAGAEEEYRWAVALNPKSADAHGQLGTLLDITGRLDEGWKEQQIAFELDPNNARLFDYTLSCGLELRGQYDRAIAIYQMFLKRDPDDGYTHLGLARDYLKKGMYKEAMPHLEQFWTLFGFPDVAAEVDRALSTSGYRGAILESARALEHLIATHQAYGPVSTAELYATLGDKDRAFYWLEQAYSHRDFLAASTDDPLGWISEDQLLDPLRSDPRFKDLLRRIGLPELHVNESLATGQTERP
jgi:TolB-like protein/DNA-binding winged helix-turn-helix (wHTH) protein/tetratricopeptide (TPR) repeat protein